MATGRAYALLALLMMSSSVDYHKPQWLTVVMKQDRERRPQIVRSMDYEHRSCGSEAKIYLTVYREPMGSN